MFEKYDLHTHSTASDGTLSPAELIQRAAEAGITVVALTDHDTTLGLAAAAEAAREWGVRLIPGVEVSVTWQSRVIHIVGLGIAPDNMELNQGLESLREFRHWRAEEIGRRLGKSGIAGAYEGARKFSRGHLIGRAHFARFLVDQGYAPDFRKVFKQYLVRGKPGYVPGQWASLENAVAWIRAAGGQAVIAHPARYPLTRTRLRRLMTEFMDAGGEGIEVVSGCHSRDDVFKIAAHTRDFGLLASTGSDYHGPEQPWTSLGRLPTLPQGVKPIWQDWTPVRSTT
ncbi:MAG: PHP domain-containing protein [Gammaproteobacteria bacterium]|nr:PHP domain-containing protein [Gammaproteobacteria bacterium]